MPGAGAASGAGIHCLAIPLPFGMRSVNCYLIEDEPLTLVDCGPNTATALEALTDALGRHGHRLEDVGLLVLTHQHADHTGLAHALARRAGAEVACLDALAPYLEDWDARLAREDEYMFALLAEHGVPDTVLDVLRTMHPFIHGYGAPTRVDRRLRDGERVRLRGRDLVVAHRPGHSPSDTVLHDPAHRVLLGGDHLLSGVSSNAFVTRPLAPEHEARRPQPLLEYRRSLGATAAMDLDVVLGGHLEPVVDHVALIAHRIARQDQKAEALLALLGQGPRSAHELAAATWGRGAIENAFLTVSEVLGHLDLLIDDGRVIEDRSGAVVRFQPADQHR